MKSWPLKIKFGLYAAGLTTAALVVAAGSLLPFIYYRQVAELDERMKDDAEELFRDLENFKGTPVDPRKPVNGKFVPVALRYRYIELEGPEGQTLFRSANLRDTDLLAESEGLRTIRLFDRNARIGVFRQGPFTLHIGTRLGTIERMQEDLRFGFYVIVPVTALLVFGGGLLLGRRALRPVAELTAAAERISAERPAERLPVPPAKDEIARLTEVLNRSFDRLQLAYNAASRFSADASHQLKTPVTVLRVGLDDLRGCGYLREAELESVNDLLQQTRRLTTLIEDLLLLAQADSGRLRLDAETLDLVPLLESVIEDIEVLGMRAGLTVERDFPAILQAHGDRRRVGSILQSLAENAVKYNCPGGRVRLSARCEGGTARIAVANTGTTIAPAETEHIFERFHRGVGEDVKGHGLGLNIARELARAHGGELVLKRSEDGWTEFELRLPCQGVAGCS